jgi:hypothetical protein
VVLPVLAGLVVTGTALAHVASGTSVRDSVYQTCAHNGVHFNKQGHANCGLHKGWTRPRCEVARRREDTRRQVARRHGARQQARLGKGQERGGGA